MKVLLTVLFFAIVIWCMTQYRAVMAKQFTLVRWIEDDTVGVMPLSAVEGKDCMPCVGATVDMRWRGKKTYEAEILRISR